jgi:hypothetical protein
MKVVKRQEREKKSADFYANDCKVEESLLKEKMGTLSCILSLCRIPDVLLAGTCGKGPRARGSDPRHFDFGLPLHSAVCYIHNSLSGQGRIGETEVKSGERERKGGYGLRRMSALKQPKYRSWGI